MNIHASENIGALGVIIMHIIIRVVIFLCDLLGISPFADTYRYVPIISSLLLYC